MTDAERDALGGYVREIADLIELRDWRFTIDAESPENDGHAAAIARVYGRKQAVIQFSPDWKNRSPEQHRQNVVHELIHCHFGALRDSAEMACLQGLSSPAYTIWHQHFEHLEEHAVDAIADALAPHLPLPPIAQEE